MEHHRRLARVLVDECFPDWTSAQKGSAMRVMVPVLEREVTSLTDDVRLFHEKFGLTYEGGPRILPDTLYDFRYTFLCEELAEYAEAWENKNITKMLDALVDLCYVLMGTAYLHGFDFAGAWDEVHRANMRKVRAERPGDTKRDFQFDVVKPAGWQPPNLKRFIS